MTMIFQNTHYENINSVKTIEDIKAIFPTGEANDMNWCVFSTSGVHGTYTDLEDIERFHSDPIQYRKEALGDEYEGSTYEPELTVLIIQPRLVSMKYGVINVLKEDIPYLRKLVTSSLHAITQTQIGNLD